MEAGYPPGRVNKSSSIWVSSYTPVEAARYYLKICHTRKESASDYEKC